MVMRIHIIKSKISNLERDFEFFIIDIKLCQ